jgi:superfamily II DNA/RNA helicase
MLDMGFIDDIMAIISHLPKQRQTLMFSATMPNEIRTLAKRILNDPAEISLAMSKPAEGVDQKAYLVHEGQKEELLSRILKGKAEYDSIIIFTSTKSKVSDIVRALRKAGYAAHGISSNLEQDEREEVMRKFRAKRIRILVATDVLSRGIDVKEINMVVNFDVPHDAEDYVHRVGRTARVNAIGEAVTIVTPREVRHIRQIEKLIGSEIPKLQPPEELGELPQWTSGEHVRKKGSGFKGKPRQGDKGRRNWGQKRRGEGEKGRR